VPVVRRYRGLHGREAIGLEAREQLALHARDQRRALVRLHAQAVPYLLTGGCALDAEARPLSRSAANMLRFGLVQLPVKAARRACDGACGGLPRCYTDI
jgi:hypothetical protein